MSAYPPATASPTPPRESRLSTLLRHPERSAALLALLIAFASVMSAGTEPGRILDSMITLE